MKFLGVTMSLLALGHGGITYKLGSGYCRDKDNANTYSHGQFCVESLEECRTICAKSDVTCRGFAYAGTPVDNHQGCRDQGKARCVTYNDDRYNPVETLSDPKAATTQRNKEIRGAYICYSSAQSSPKFMMIDGRRSAKHDDAQSQATCPTGTVLTGCGCHSSTHSCDGAKAKDLTCYAYNDGRGGSGVTAQAICGDLADISSGWTTVQGSKSGKQNDAPSTATCPSGTVITDCECHSPWDSCDGAQGHGNSCTAYNKGGGSGVFAQARCGKFDWWGIDSDGEWVWGDEVASDWQWVLGAKSGCVDDASFVDEMGDTCEAFNTKAGYCEEYGADKNEKGVRANDACCKCKAKAQIRDRDDDQSIATCPHGTTLTGCTCYSPWHSCDGSKATGNSCVAFNRAGGLGVFAQARCGTFRDVKKYIDVEGAQSGKFDDAPSKAECPTGTVLSGCECFSYWASCDGAKGEGNACYAYNDGKGGHGVWAQARCLHTSSTISHSYITRDNHNRFGAVAECPSGQKMTGCSCHSPWDSCDGSYISGEDPVAKCYAHNTGVGKGVRAQARCLELPGSSGWTQVKSKESGKGDDEPTYAVCPPGTTLTGCSCFSKDFMADHGSCDGAKTIGNTCIAYNKAGGSGVFAEARCGKI